MNALSWLLLNHCVLHSSSFAEPPLLQQRKMLSWFEILLHLPLMLLLPNMVLFILSCSKEKTKRVFPLSPIYFPPFWVLTFFYVCIIIHCLPSCAKHWLLFVFPFPPIWNLSHEKKRSRLRHRNTRESCHVLLLSFIICENSRVLLFFFCFSFPMTYAVLRAKKLWKLLFYFCITVRYLVNTNCSLYSYRFSMSKLFVFNFFRREIMKPTRKKCILCFSIGYNIWFLHKINFLSVYHFDVWNFVLNFCYLLPICPFEVTYKTRGQIDEPR